MGLWNAVRGRERAFHCGRVWARGEGGGAEGGRWGGSGRGGWWSGHRGGANSTHVCQQKGIVRRVAQYRRVAKIQCLFRRNRRSITARHDGTIGRPCAPKCVPYRLGLCLVGGGGGGQGGFLVRSLVDGAGSYSVAHSAGLLPTELTGMWGWILPRSPRQGRGSSPAPAPTHRQAYALASARRRPLVKG